MSEVNITTNMPPIVGKTILRKETVDSTNTYLKSLLKEYIEEGTVVIAEEQTAGRGRLGRSWVSQKGQNLTFSILLRPDVAFEHFGLISIFSGLAVARSIRATTSLLAECKWPNDILCNNFKVCGILSEAVTGNGNSPAVILGIGINVNQTEFPEELQATASSLLLEYGHKIDKELLLRKVFEDLDYWYMQFRQQNFSTIISTWKTHSSMIGKIISLNQNGTMHNAVCSDIAENGALVTEHAGTRRYFYAGDVTILKK